MLQIVSGLRRLDIEIPDDIYQILESVDADQSGEVDYTEFVAAVMDRNNVSLYFYVGKYACGEVRLWMMTIRKLWEVHVDSFRTLPLESRVSTMWSE